MPPFEGLHPLVVHIPIGLLCTVWIPALVACFMKQEPAKHWWFATLLWYAVGVSGAMFAVITGDAAIEIVGSTSEEVSRLLDVHEIRAEQARRVFILSFLIALSAFLVRYVSPDRKWGARIKLTLVLGVIGIVTYVVGARLLLLAAHAGGELVHVHGIHAPIE